MAREGSPRRSDRVRVPRVSIGCEVEVDGCAQTRELPFVLGVIANLGGAGIAFSRRTFQPVSADTLEELFAQVRPRLVIDLPPGEPTGTRERVDLGFASLEDFSPQRVAMRMPSLRDVRRGSQVVRHPDFQRLEAAWRGLAYLLDECPPADDVRIEVLDASRAELVADLQRAPAVHETTIGRLVLEREGAPFSCVLSDLEFGAADEDLELLEHLAQIASLAHAPLIAAPSPAMFGLPDFASLASREELEGRFADDAHERWKRFRASEDAGHVALCVPRILLRDAFGRYPGIDALDPARYLWGSAAWALGSRIATAFATHGWCAHIHGVEGGGLVERLPVHTFSTEEGDIVLQCPTEAPLADRRERELAALGFATLVHCRGTPNAAFLSVPSCQAGEGSRAPELPHLLAVGRFAHGVLAAASDGLQRGRSAAELEVSLRRWIDGYVLTAEEGTAVVGALHPLREAHLDVVAGSPSERSVRVVAALWPHHQLEELAQPLRVVVDVGRV